MKPLINYSTQLIAGIFLIVLLVIGPVLYAQTADMRRLQVQRIYTSQIGVREKKANAGAEVEKYLNYVNLREGNAWCAAFVCWALGQGRIANPKTGWSPALFPPKQIIWEQDIQVNKALQKEENSGKVKVGTATRTGSGPGTADVFGIYFPEKGRIAHVGFVDEWQEPWLKTVEGNTNLPGGREGDGVYRKRRLVRSVYRVARYIY